MTRDKGDLFWLHVVRITARNTCIRSRPHVYIYSNNSDVITLNYCRTCNIVNAYPDIVIKMYSNNGRIVDADDEYLSTSEWRFTNRLFRIEQIQ